MRSHLCIDTRITTAMRMSSTCHRPITHRSNAEKKIVLQGGERPSVFSICPPGRLAQRRSHRAKAPVAASGNLTGQSGNFHPVPVRRSTLAPELRRFACWRHEVPLRISGAGPHFPTRIWRKLWTFRDWRMRRPAPFDGDSNGTPNEGATPADAAANPRTKANLCRPLYADSELHVYF
jgi:hypothetical protein